MIDLHLHTTASDGRLAPADLVRRARRAGITILSVTDHDTTAGIEEAAAAARACAAELVPGIEITAVHEGRDVHVLGYFLDAGSAELQAFLAAQRRDRIRRVEAIAGRLARLGLPIDLGPALSVQTGGRSIGRPLVAAAMVKAGHVATLREAFDGFLVEGRPAFEPRRAAPPAEVVQIIARAGGVASLAHPGLLGRDELIHDLASRGLHALEVYHSDHGQVARRHYRELADRLGLAVTGGSDYHGESMHRATQLGAVGLPPEDFARLRALARTGART